MKGHIKRHIWIAVIFFLLAIVITFPLVFNLTTSIPGFFSSDENVAPLWNSWHIKYSFRHGISVKKITDLITYPFGFNIYASGYSSYLWFGIIYVLSILTNPAFTYNIQIFYSLLLICLFTYFLTFYLTKNKLSAFFSGVIFGFCPFQFARAWQHLGLIYNQWIPLCLLAAILLKERGQKKHSLLFLSSLLLLFSFDFSIMYLGIISLSVFFIYVIFYQFGTKLFNARRLKEDFRYIKKAFTIGLISFFLLLPQFFPVIKNRLTLSSTTKASAFNPYRRPFEDLFAQSARPLSYFLPATVHPVFGKFTERFIGSSLYGDSFTEHTLYLGWIPLILAFVAFRRWKRKKGDFYVGFFIFLAIIAWLFSQPPWWNIFGFKLYMPSFFMYKILPMYRAYCRFGIVLMLAVAVLAGFGLKSILERFKSSKIKVATTVLACGLVLFEFWNWPPYKVIDVAHFPAVYEWLKNQPGDIVIAEYPLDRDSPNEMYKFYQIKHEKKIINGTIPGTYANKVARGITKLSDFRSAGILKWMGVKYVLIHKEGYLNTGLIDQIEELNKIPKNRGLKFLKTFPSQGCFRKDMFCVKKTGPIDIYEVIAKPIEPKIEK